MNENLIKAHIGMFRRRYHVMSNLGFVILTAHTVDKDYIKAFLYRMDYRKRNLEKL